MLASKQIHIISGPNGSGKTTKAELLLPAGFLETNEFVNADNIARGISPYNLNSKSANFQAGMQMLKRIDNLTKAGKNFAFETTLSGKIYANLIKKYQKLGYLVNLIFLYSNDPNLNVARVEQRVQKGGHHIDSNIIKRRYFSGIQNLFNLYLPIVDSATIFDGSKIEFNPKTDKIAEKSASGLKVFEEKIWGNLLTISNNNF